MPPPKVEAAAASDFSPETRMRFGSALRMFWITFDFSSGEEGLFEPEFMQLVALYDDGSEHVQILWPGD
jgi:hypothetical protein